MKPGGPRVLVIDDDPLVKETLSFMIEREGWSFYGADNVEEAVAAVNDIEPEVIVLEPRADHGKAAVLLVEVHQAAGWIPVILHTADPSIDDAYALEHGASGLLRKPLDSRGMIESDSQALRDRIATLLDARKTDRPT